MIVIMLLLLLLLLSCFSRVRLCVTPQTAAYQAPPSLGFSRQEHWSGLPFPSPMYESEKWKWSRSVVSNSWQPHGLQPTRLLRPWDFPGKSTGVGVPMLSPFFFLRICLLLLFTIVFQLSAGDQVHQALYIKLETKGGKFGAIIQTVCKRVIWSVFNQPHNCYSTVW